MRYLVLCALTPVLFLTLSTTCLAQISGPSGPVPLPVSKRVGKAEVSYNESRNETTVQTIPLRIESPLDVILQARFRIKGKEIVEPRSVILAFSILSKDDTYAKNRVLKLYLEGEEILSATASLVAAQPDSRGVWLVRISQEVPYDLFVKLGSGKNVRIKLGPSEFGLSKDLLEALRDVKKSVGS